MGLQCIGMLSTQPSTLYPDFSDGSYDTPFRDVRFLGKVLSLRSVNVEPPQSSEPGNHLSLAPSRICQEEVSRLCSQPRLLSILNRPWTIWRPSRNMRSLCIDSLAEPVSLMSVSRISHWDNGITFKLIASVCEIPWEMAEGHSYGYSEERCHGDLSPVNNINCS